MDDFVVGAAAAVVWHINGSLALKWIDRLVHFVESRVPIFVPAGIGLEVVMLQYLHQRSQGFSMR